VLKVNYRKEQDLKREKTRLQKCSQGDGTHKRRKRLLKEGTPMTYWKPRVPHSAEGM